MVRSRVDRLGPGPRDAVVAASVLGTEFTLSELRAISSGEDDVSGEISELCASGLLVEVPRTSRHSYRFRHALIQEAIYKGLLKRQRRGLHAKVAWALEAASADRLNEVADALGRHYAAAGDAERAFHFLEMAGDHAASVFANEEAVSSYRAALEIVNMLPTDQSFTALGGGRLRAKLADVLRHIGQHGAARELLHQAIQVTGSEKSLFAAQLHNLLGKVELDDRDYDAAVVAFDAAEMLLAGRPDDQATIDMWLDVQLQGRALVYFGRNDPATMAAVLAEVRPVLDARGTPAQKQAYFAHMGLRLQLERGHRIDEELLASHRAGLAAAEDGCGEYEIGWRLENLGFVLVLHGDLDEAQETLTAAVRISERIGEVHMQADCLCDLTLAAIRRHDAQAVAALVPRAVEAAQAAGFRGSLGQAKSGLTWLAWRERRWPDVEALANEALPLLRTDPVSHSLCWVCLWPLIAVRLRSGQVADAIIACRELLLLPQLRLPDEVESAVQAAVEAWDNDRNNLAKELLTQSIHLAEKLRYL